MKAWKGVFAGAAFVLVASVVPEPAGAVAAAAGPVAAAVELNAASATGMFWADGRSGLVKIKGLRGRGFSRGGARRGMVFRGRSFPGDRYTYESATRGMGTRTYRFRYGDNARSLRGNNASSLRRDNARSVRDRGSRSGRVIGMGGPTVGTFGLRRGLDGRLRLRKGFGQGIGFKTR